MTPPAWLNNKSKSYFRKLTVHVTEDDRDALALLCDSLARYRECSEILNSEGMVMPTSTGSIKARPEVYIQKSCADVVLKWSKHLGLNQRQTTHDADELDELMGA